MAGNKKLNGFKSHDGPVASEQLYPYQFLSLPDIPTSSRSNAINVGPTDKMHPCPMQAQFKRSLKNSAVTDLLSFKLER